VSTLTNVFFFVFVLFVQNSGNEATPMVAYFGCVYALILLINSAINFVFYCAFGKKFRQECKALLSPIIKRLPVENIPKQSTLTESEL